MTLEFQVQPSSEEIATGLSRIRRWYRAYWLAWVVGVPVDIVVSGIVASFTTRWPLAVPSVLLLIMIVGLGVRANDFACPRCGKRYWPIGNLQLPWSVECPWCGLRPKAQST